MKQIALDIGLASSPSFSNFFAGPNDVALKHLELWFGQEDYGCSSTVKSLAAILSGKGLPALERLGLMNSEWEAELINAIAASKLLPQLKVLDLSMGVLFTEGAAALINHKAKFAHLKKLILDDNYLEEQSDALKKALPMVEMGTQREPDGEDDDEFARYVSVGE